MLAIRVWRFAVLALCLMAGRDLLAQTGGISGRVTRADAGIPIPGARVQAINANGQTAASVLSQGDGAYRITNLTPGTYALQVSAIGYDSVRVSGIAVSAGGTASSDVAMTAITTRLNPVVVTQSRGAQPERIQDSPNPISIIDAERIAERPAATVTDHLKGISAVSISTGGIAQSNIVSRGFNNAFSTSMLMLQDYRFAGVPSLRVNVPFLFTGTGDDIDRIEVLQGPVAALYGPNSGNGVLHVITKSPFTSQGTSITLDGGERSLLRAGLRTAQTLSDKVGFKLAGEYFTAKDFEYRDPNEPANFSSTDTRIPVSRRGDPVVRNFDLSKYSGEARLDIRPDSNTEIISSAGMSHINRGMEITTTFGAAQVVDWSYVSLQQRFRHKQFFAQAFYNKSNSGNADPLDDAGTYYLRTGIPVVDRSSVTVGQVQQGLELGRTRVVIGGEGILTRPKTVGSINGRNDGDDAINEFGAYIQTTTTLSPKLEFLAAIRGDRNSRIEGTQASPRAALVFKPAPGQNFRLTFNRAFNSPASFAFFLDQFSGSTPAPGLPVQIMGNPPKIGWNFDRSCAGGLCMRSPYLPGLQPASAGALALPGLFTRVGGVSAIEAVVAAQPASVFGGPQQKAAFQAGLAQLLPLIASFRPTAAEIPSGLVDLNTRTPVSSVNDYAPLGANFSNTWEIGYKGLFANRVSLAADLWFQRRPSDPTAQVINPGVVLAGPQLAAYLGPRLIPALMQAGQTQAQAQAFVTGLVTVAAQVPIGAGAFNSPLYDKPMLVFSYQNAAGYVNVSGLDLAADMDLTQAWSLAASYSYLSDNVFPNAPGATPANPLAANVPNHRASAALRYVEPTRRNFSAEFRGRYANAFPVNSGVFNSYGIGTPTRYPEVPVNAFIDVGMSWKLPVAQNVRWSVNVTNLLDNKRQTFVGTPEIGRLALTRLSYTF